MNTRHMTDSGSLLSMGACLLNLLFVSGISLAGDENVMSESYYFEEFPVTLTSTRLSQPFEDTPNAMTVIDKEMIRATGALSIPDLLRLVPGMTVTFYAGSRAAATYHGLSDQYARDMQVLIDGRSVYDPGYGGVSWSDLPIETEDINRIEVIRGPNATAYGSNSYAGVINIITEHPADLSGSKISANAGEGGRRKLYARHAAKTAGFNIKITAAHNKGDGYDDRSDDFKSEWISFHGDKKLDDDNRLQLLAGAGQGTYEEGYSGLLRQVRELDNSYNFQQISWKYKQSNDNHFQLQLYHNHQNIDDTNRSPPISELIMSYEKLQDVPENIRLDVFANSVDAPDFNSFLSALNITDGRFLISWLGMSSDRYDLEFEQTLQASPLFRLAWGAGFRRDEAKSTQIFHQTDPVSRDQGRLFANGEWRTNQNLVFNLGGMLEDYENHASIFSYRAAGNLHFNRQHTFRINKSRAYRMPTLYEEYVNFVIFFEEPFNDINTWTKTQGDIDPQRLDSLELGYLGNFSTYGLTLDVKLFEERYRNVIVLYRDFDYPDPDRGLADTTVLDKFNAILHKGAQNHSNNGIVDIYGLEVNAKFLPTHRDLLFLGYSYLHTKGVEIQRHEDGVYHMDEDVYVRAPSHTFSLLLSHRFHSSIDASMVYYFTDAMTWYNEGDPVPEYKRLDLRLAKRFKLLHSNAELALLVQNINGENLDFYNGDPYRNILGKRAYLQFKTTF
jgi:iron complex outermembrane receptor protein